MQPLNEITDKYIELGKKLSASALKKSGKDLAAYIKNLGLTPNKLTAVIATLKGYTGGLAYNTKAYVNNIKEVKNLNDALTILRETNVKGKGDNAKPKPRDLTINLSKITAKGFVFETKEQEKIFKQLKVAAKRMGLDWDVKTQAYALRIATVSPKLKIPKSMKKVKVPEDPAKAINKTDKATKDATASAVILGNVAASAGTQIANAFFGAKFSADQFLGSLLKIAAQMAIVGALQAWVSGGTLGIFGTLAKVASHSVGGFADNPQHFKLVNPKVFANAPHFSGGGIAGIPAILHKKEMILTEADQLNLFNMIRSGRSGRGRGRGGSADINIKLGLKTDKNKFVSDFNKADVIHKKTRGLGSVNIKIGRA